MRRKHDWAKTIEDQRRVDHSLKDYCELHGLSLGSFRVAKSKNNKKFPLGQDASGFLELEMVKIPLLEITVSERCELEIHINICLEWKI